MTVCMYILKCISKDCLLMKQKNPEKHFYIYFVLCVILRLKNQRLRTRRSWRFWDWRAPEREIRRVTARSSPTAVPYVLCICQWFWCKSLAKTNRSIKSLILSHKVLNLVLFNFARNTFAIIFLFVHIKVKAFMIKIACKVVRINRIFLFTWPYQWLISKTIWEFEILNILLITLIQNCVLFLERG